MLWHNATSCPTVGTKGLLISFHRTTIRWACAQTIVSGDPKIGAAILFWHQVCIDALLTIRNRRSQITYRFFDVKIKTNCRCPCTWRSLDQCLQTIVVIGVPPLVSFHHFCLELSASFFFLWVPFLYPFKTETSGNPTIGFITKQIKKVFLTFLGLDSRFWRFPAGSGQDFWRRIRIWSQICWILTHRSQNVRKTT